MPPFTSSLSQVPYPALYLYPLNDSFVPKHIALLPNQRVKIGRQTNAKTVPGERNGYFDSKVLSRQHAEVWEENGKIFIKDVKSSNGTFINGERLSGEGLESDPFELKSEDVVEYGIDIVGEDNKTIIHHKVAARVVCILSEQDMQLAARAEAQQHPPSYTGLAGQVGPGGGFSFASGQSGGVNGVPGAQRRSTIPQGLVGMGGMGAGARAPGKSGLSFDHILSRLQGELQKSRETGADLHTLSGAMNDIHDTLGGNLPPNIPPFPQTLPPVVPPQPNQPSEPHQPAPPPTTQDSASALAELQAQLHETQRSLASHVEKIRALEGLLAEHEAIKHEVGAMRDMMEERKREMELFRLRSQSPNDLRRHHSRIDDGMEEESSDDDDARSVATLVLHELERVDEEDEEQIAAEEEEERRRRTDEFDRPRTPEPTGMGMHEDDDEHDQGSPESSNESLHLRPLSPTSANLPTTAAPSSSPAIPDDLLQRMTALSNQLESALELSRTLEAQHQNAQSTISVLESKVSALESLVQSTQSQVQAQGEAHQQLAQALDAKRAEEPVSPPLTLSAWEEERARDRESLTSILNEWKKNVEGQWSGVQEEWSEERERLRRAKETFEARLLNVEDTLGNTAAKVETGLASMASFQLQHQHLPANGSAKINGLVTPPSPRSLSASATRPRQRKKRPSSSSRGRSRSRSLSPSAAVDVNEDSPVSPTSRDLDDTSSTSSRLQRRMPWHADDSSASESDHLEKHGEHQVAPGMYPTPDPSLLDQPVSGLSSSASTVVAEAQTKGHPKELPPQFQSLSTVVGVLVLSVAAAAVIWRVKPEGGV